MPPNPINFLSSHFRLKYWVPSGQTNARQRILHEGLRLSSSSRTLGTTTTAEENDVFEGQRYLTKKIIKGAPHIDMLDNA